MKFSNETEQLREKAAQANADYLAAKAEYDAKNAREAQSLRFITELRSLELAQLQQRVELEKATLAAHKACTAEAKDIIAEMKAEYEAMVIELRADLAELGITAEGIKQLNNNNGTVEQFNILIHNSIMKQSTEYWAVAKPLHDAEAEYKGFSRQQAEKIIQGRLDNAELELKTFFARIR